MALKRSLLIAIVGLAFGRSASAQSLITELDATVGASTQEVTAASTQGRIFGELISGWRYFAEVTWAQVSHPETDHESDAFGAAYPYEGQVRPMELFVEKTVARPRFLVGTRLGRYRTPFGIYSRSDYGYVGFLRAPLIRYGGYWALSNTFLETGASVVAGTSHVQAEVSLGTPQDADPETARPRGLDRVGRLQGSFGSWIVGTSYIHTQPPKVYWFATGATEFVGVDARWMKGGVLVRGEFINGREFSGTRTSGGYVDVLVHRAFMGPMTAVARAERLDYDAGRHSSYPRRYTAGAKVRVSSIVVANVNVLHAPAHGDEGPESAVDMALTLSFRR